VGVSLADSGSGVLTVQGATVAVDSAGHPAVTLSGNGSIKAPAVRVVGTASVTGRGTIANLTAGVAPTPDPLAGVAAPSVPRQASVPSVNLTAGSQTIPPGVYQNITITGQGSLTLDPGTYLILGHFAASGQGQVTGSNVSLYLACGLYPTPCGPGEHGATLALTGNGAFHLSGPSTGCLPLAIYSDPNNASDIDVTGNGSDSLAGSVYAPSGSVILTSNGSTFVLAGSVIAGSTALSGNGNVTLASRGPISCTLALSPSTAGPDPVGTSQELTATVRDATGAPVPGQTVAVTVTGANPASGSATTDAAGTAYFSYQGTAVGTDTATASLTEGATTRQSNTSTITWIKATPQMSASPAAGTVTVGQPIGDTATVSGGFSPGGSVSFNVYSADDTSCQTPLNHNPLTANLTNGQASSPDFTPSTAGTYQFVATYEGDQNNQQVATKCGDPSEQVTVHSVAPPAPTITSRPADPTNQASAEFSFDDSAAGVQFQCQLDGGQFTVCSSPQHYPGPLADGPHSFSVEAVDSLGNASAAASYSWTIDTATPPAPTITSGPADPTNQTTADFVFTEPATGTSLLATPLATSGWRFQCQLDGGAFSDCTSPQHYPGPLADGPHTFLVKATDPAGNTSPAASYSWVVQTTPPPPPTIDAQPADPTTLTSADFGFSDPASGVHFQCQLDGSGFSDCSGTQHYPGPLADGPHTFQVIAVGVAGSSDPATVTWQVQTGTGGTYNAPAIDPTLPTTVYSSTQFLYSGSSPAQTGVADGTIVPERASAIRGKVLDENGQPLAGATITIFDHPEFGQTTSQSDGSYTMVVNGGGSMVVNIAMAGRTTVQRKVDPRWQDWSVVDDVALLPLDSAVNAISFDNTTATQLARGNPVSDSAGTRQATLLTPAGTHAQLVKSDGSTESASELHIRLTEVTKGDIGPQALPGELPATNVYTYAVDYTADEALAAGAVSVHFDQPLIAYTEDFVGAPVGALVPSGSYESTTPSWVAQPDGRVVKIISVTNGLADVDTTGKGTADNTGLSVDERAQLAGLYTPGTQLMRVPVQRFSFEDYNFNGFPIRQPLPTPPADKPPTPCDEPTQSGSIIGCDSQSLAEQLRIPGSQFTLDYHSDRQFGGSDYSVDVPVVPPGFDFSQIPGDVIFTPIAQLSIGGSLYQQRFEGLQHPRTAHLTWNGRDVFGRVMQGRQRAQVRVCYQFGHLPEMEAQSSGPGGGSSWGQAAAANAVEFHTTPGMAYECSAWVDRTLGHELDQPLGLGGWTLSGVTPYDGSLGAQSTDGQSLAAGDSIARLRHLAGHGATGVLSPDGTVATAASLGVVQALASAPDGAMYFAEQECVPGGCVGHGERVREVTPAGKLKTIAGGAPGYAGDGGPAAAAQFSQNIRALAVGPDGSLYVADTDNNRVRKITPDGNVTTFAGNGQGCSQGENSYLNSTLPPTQRPVCPWGLTVAPDGTVYVADFRQQVIWRVDAADRMTRWAGGGTKLGTAGDGGPATDAILGRPGYDGPSLLAIAPDGSLVTNDQGTFRRIGPDGRISTVPGVSVTNPTNGSELSIGHDGTIFVSENNLGFCPCVDNRITAVAPDGHAFPVAGNDGYGAPDFPENSPAQTTEISAPTALAITPDGSLAFVGGGRGLIGEVTVALPGSDLSQFTVASPDGQTLTAYDADGRPSTVYNTLTGGVLVRYDYDSAGHLTSARTPEGTLQITHDSAGNPTSIIAPGGHTLELSTANGYLWSVHDPVSGDTTWLGYTPGGRLTSMTGPDGPHGFAYDSGGYLTSDHAPDGRAVTLTRQETDSSRAVSVSVDGDAPTVYKTDWSSPGTVTRETDAPGEQPATEVDSGPKTTTTAPDGLVTTTAYGPDPRFGMQAPVPVSVSAVEPGGRTITGGETRTASLSDPTNPLSLTSLTDSRTVGRRTTKTVFTAATRILNTTTPAGRTATVTLDDLGRPVGTQTDSRVAPTTFSYDGQGRLAATNQSTQSLSYHYDSDNRTVSSTEANSDTTQWQYDDANRTITTKSPDGHSYHETFDPLGNLASTAMPAGGEFATAFDSQGALTGFSAPQNPALTIQHNSQEGAIKAVYPDGTTETDTRDASNRLTARTSGDGTNESYGYDSVGRLTSASRNDDPGTTSESLTWDGLHPAMATFAGATTGTYSYTNDALGEPTGIQLDGGTVQTRAYDNDGLVTQDGDFHFDRSGPAGATASISGDGMQISNTFDNLGQLATRTVALNGKTVTSSSYQYDPKTGQLAQQDETVAGSHATATYSYDGDGQLTGVARTGGAPNESYAYDSDGNRTSRQLGAAAADTYTYDKADRLTTAAGAPATVNTNGDVVGLRGDTFSYGAHGELLSATLPSGSRITYRYDAQFRRVTRTDSQGTTQYLYGDPTAPLRITATRGPDGTLTTYAYDDQGRALSETRQNTQYFVITDQVGTPKAILDSSGNVVETTQRDAFGNVDLRTGDAGLMIGFAGGLEDPATGLVRFGLRDYDPSTGRWMQQDPALYGGGQWNLYAYAGSDPLNRRDPTGLDKKGWGFGINVDVDAILPIFSGGGGSWGINIQWLSTGPNQGWHIYGYGPGRSPSVGVALGASCQIDVAVGNGGWTGLFDSAGGGYGWGGGSYFESPGASDTGEGWVGISFGVGKGAPFPALYGTQTDYTLWR
jgi:RHS repeat-associated protein